jgi:hypothetical protein
MDKLSAEQECNLVGVVLHVSTRHYWILPIEDYESILKLPDNQLKRIVVVEINRRSVAAPHTGVTSYFNDSKTFNEHRVSLSDLTYQYEDPRHSFKVMLEGDFSTMNSIIRKVVPSPEIFSAIDSMIGRIKALVHCKPLA